MKALNHPSLRGRRQKNTRPRCSERHTIRRRGMLAGTLAGMPLDAVCTARERPTRQLLPACSQRSPAPHVGRRTECAAAVQCTVMQCKCYYATKNSVRLLAVINPSNAVIWCMMPSPYISVGHACLPVLTAPLELASLEALGKASSDCSHLRGSLAKCILLYHV